MTTLRNRIVDLLNQNPGLSDREIANRLLGIGTPQQSVNAACRKLDGVIIRRSRKDGLIGNYLTSKSHISKPPDEIRISQSEEGSLSEDKIKDILENYLRSLGWVPTIAWGQTHGIDIEAKRGSERWVIEVKGSGSSPQMRNNSFLSILGGIVQRMDDPTAKYSIALPDRQQFRDLWGRLPMLAKKRTGITAIFVDLSGKVTEEEQ